MTSLDASTKMKVLDVETDMETVKSTALHRVTLAVPVTPYRITETVMETTKFTVLHKVMLEVLVTQLLRTTETGEEFQWSIVLCTVTSLDANSKRKALDVETDMETVKSMALLKVTLAVPVTPYLITETVMETAKCTVLLRVTLVVPVTLLLRTTETEEDFQ